MDSGILTFSFSNSPVRTHMIASFDSKRIVLSESLSACLYLATKRLMVP
jgi:hypothetical protein